MTQSTLSGVPRGLTLGVSPRLLKIAVWLLTGMLLGTLGIILLALEAARILGVPDKLVADVANAVAADPKTTGAVTVFAISTALAVAAYIWKTEL